MERINEVIGCQKSVLLRQLRISIQFSSVCENFCKLFGSVRCFPLLLVLEISSELDSPKLQHLLKL